MLRSAPRFRVICTSSDKFARRPQNTGARSAGTQQAANTHRRFDGFGARPRLYSVVVLSRVAFRALEFAKSQLEWMSDGMMRQFEESRNPFQLRSVHLSGGEAQGGEYWARAAQRHRLARISRHEEAHGGTPVAERSFSLPPPPFRTRLWLGLTGREDDT